MGEVEEILKFLLYLNFLVHCSAIFSLSSQNLKVSCPVENRRM